MTAPKTRSAAARKAAAGLLTASLFAGACAAPAATAAAPDRPAAVAAKAAKKKAKKKPAVKRRSGTHGRKGKTLSGSVSLALSKVPAYDGPTGAVVHSKSVTVNFITGEDPLEDRGYSQITERWAEIGGGMRERNVRVSRDEDTMQLKGTTEDWRTDRIWAVIPSAGTASVAIFCDGRLYDPAGPDARIRADQARLAELPEGPQINGVATRVGVHTEAVPGATTNPEWRNYLDASTGTPLRTTYRGVNQSIVNFVTDYSLWELLPAGGSAADLSSPLPAGTVLGDDDRGRPGCIG